MDEDAVSHARKHTMASSIFGINALLTKPAQSIAPSIGALVLQPFGYGDSAPGASLHPNIGNALFLLLVWCNIVCAVVQVAVWWFYDLHSHNLKNVKRAIEEHKIEHLEE